MSTGLSSLSALTVHDLAKPLRPELAERKATLIAKLSGKYFNFIIKK